MNKHFILLFFAVMLAGAVSCKKDNNTNTGGNNNGGNNNGGNDNLPALNDADKITEWLNVENATVKQGDIPTASNASLKISVVDANSTAIVDVGFLSRFITEGNYAGAYVKVKGAKTYLDIPLRNDNERKAKSSPTKHNQRTTDDGENLDIFFGLSDESVIGTFCYEIWLYDAANQVSNTVEVCVTINNVGGNDQLVGKWAYYIHAEYNSDGIFKNADTLEYGQQGEFACYNEISDEGFGTYQVKEYEWIELLKDGNYSDNYSKVAQGAIPVYCQANFYNNEEHTFYPGKWSYDPGTKRIMTIDQVYYKYYRAPNEEKEVYNIPEIWIYGELLSVNSTTMQIKEIYWDGSYWIRTLKKLQE